MLGYLYRVTNPRIEDLVDEMLAILSDREAIIQKKELEHAQAVINDMYKNGLIKHVHVEKIQVEKEFNERT